MQLSEMTVNEFTALTASKAPAPGGGSVAALVGALGTALSAMVCSLTVGKQGYEAYEELAETSLTAAQALKDRFLDVMNRDTQVYTAVSAAFKLPRSTQEEAEARSRAVQAALKECTKTPFEMMELAAEAIELNGSLLHKTNKSAASDIGVAALSLKAALESAWLNVLINLNSIRDEAFVREYKSRGEALLARAVPLAEECSRTVLLDLQG